MEIGDVKWIDAEIHREHNLISHRMSWYVASQAFLLAAYSVGMNQGHIVRDSVPWLIPSIGIAVSFVSYLSLLAALLSMKKLREKQI